MSSRSDEKASIAGAGGWGTVLDERPTYIQWATFDIIGAGITAALAQGLRIIATANPQHKDDR